MTILEIVLAILLPPLSVFLKTGVSTQLLINIVLTLIGWIPGVVHALWVATRGTNPPTP